MQVFTCMIQKGMVPKTNESFQGWSKSVLSCSVTSGEEYFERVSVLKEDTFSTASELTMLILSISATFTVTCLTVASLITKSCQQRWPIRSCSFYRV